mmetsp:Transcript_16617/g.20302  ORF Transcript_16617/g.20302 Transcript_16617/m.20302 type:complete len:287 (-) Transcript_16617:620-1480(-)
MSYAKKSKKDVVSSAFNFKDSICVVTGAASGIGKALCMELANLAKKVVAVDIDYESTLDLVNNHMKPGIGLAIQANCGRETDMRRVILKVENEVGPIDAFFCNAGVLSVGSVTDTPNDEWDHLWKVNVMQAVYVSKYLFPLFEIRKKGAFIITASAAGLLTLPGASAYTVTKHAAVSLAEWLSMTYGSKGIAVSCLCPQAVRTAMVGDTDGGAAGLDGIMNPDDVARITIEDVQNGKFLITPHKKVRKYIADKGNDYERYIKKMIKLNKYAVNILKPPPFSARSRL